MEKIRGLCLLMCLLLAMTGCSGAEAPAPEPAAAEAAAEPEAPTPEPAPQPPPEPAVQEPQATPIQQWPAGGPVTVDGTELAHSLMIRDTLCVRLDELAQTLDVDWTWEEGKGGLLWNGNWITLHERIGGFLLEDRWKFLPVGPTAAKDGVYVPAAALCEHLGIRVLEDLERDHLYLSAAAGEGDIPAGVSVPVLMYHGVADEAWGALDLFVRPAEMEAQLQYLLENGYTPIWFEDLARADQLEKPVLLTFDDGYLDNYTELFPLLQKYAVKATVFVVAGTVDYNPNNLTSEQIREMSDSGLLSIQSHTQTHPYLATLTPEQQAWELTQSQLELTRITGKVPYVLSYPCGSFSRSTVELTRESYRFAVRMNGGIYTTDQDPLQISRRYIPRGMSMAGFAAMLQ